MYKKIKVYKSISDCPENHKIMYDIVVNYHTKLPYVHY